jgi:sporulation protein YqfC
MDAMDSRKTPPPEKGPKTRAWQMPSTLLPGSFRLEMSGNRSAVMEGCGGVLEYDGSTVRVRAGKMAVRFRGRNLEIKCLTADSLVVEGFISAVEFIT